jgi:hypothetical protein
MADCAADQDSFPNELIHKLIVLSKTLDFSYTEELNFMGTANVQTYYIWHTCRMQGHNISSIGAQYRLAKTEKHWMPSKRQTTAILKDAQDNSTSTA